MIPFLRISHSSRGTLASCGQKFYFYKFYPQPKRMIPDYAAMVGSALHKAWQDYLINHDRDKATWELLANWDVRSPEGKYEARTLEAAYSALLVIMDFVDEDGWELAYIDGGGIKLPAVEVSFEIKFLYRGKPFEIGPGLPISYIGYIDAIQRKPGTEHYRVRDLKTHRNWETDLTPKYLFDEQCIPYALIIQQALGQPLANFEIEYLACYVDLMKARMDPYEFMKGPELVQDWAKKLFVDLQTLKQYVSMEWFPRNSHACMQYGERVCQFFEPCQVRKKKYWEEYFTGGRNLEMVEQEFKPMFSMELELAQ